MRVLLVDDDAQVLRGMARVLECLDDDLCVETARGGAEALERLENCPVDVILSDMLMPGMDKAELPDEVSRLYPQILRIVLSGQADKESVYRAVRPMHQYLAKPCDAIVLRDAIVQARMLRDLLQSDACRDFAGRVKSLPSLPEMYQELVGELNHNGGSLARIGQILGRDPAMTAKILQLANSAIFGARTKVTSTSQAAALLGTDTLRTLVLSLQVFDASDLPQLPGFSAQKLLHHSLQVAGFAKQVAEALGLGQSTATECFTAGMLHDIGKLVLAARLPEQFAAALRLSSADGIPLVLAEQQQFGFSHDGIGGYLLALWGLPSGIVEAAALHHQPVDYRSEKLPVSVIVFLANSLAHEQEGTACEIQTQMRSDYLQRHGLQDRLTDWFGPASPSPRDIEEVEQC